MILVLSTLAGATPPIADCSQVAAGSERACFCVFNSTPSDWKAAGNPKWIPGTCFEFTANVNSVPAANRALVLGRMDTVAQAMACSSQRVFTRNVTVTSGVPWVNNQLLETMTDDDCGVGDLDEMREQWLTDPWVLPEW